MTTLSKFLNIKLTLIAPLYMFVPLIATIITCWLCKIPIRTLGLSLKLNRWYVFALLFPLFLSLTTLVVSLLFPNVEYSPNLEGLLRYGVPQSVIEKYLNFPIPPLLYFLIVGLITAPTINALFAFGEEIRWRGLLYNELKHLGFWKSSFLIGLIWGLWHVQLIMEGYNYPQHPIEGIFLMIIFCILLSPIFSFVRYRSNSVIANAIMHGSINAFAGISIAFVKGSDLIVGVQGLSGIILLIFVTLTLKYFIQNSQ